MSEVMISGFLKSFTDRLNRVIERKGITKREAAKLCGITEVSMSRICTGDRVPGLLVLYNICVGLGCSADYLLGTYRYDPDYEIPLDEKHDYPQVHRSCDPGYREWAKSYVENNIFLEPDGNTAD